MANSKDNIGKYATSFIGFDEESGNVYDNIGGYVGTIYNAPTRVVGWDGKGKAMRFNGNNQYAIFDRSLIPTGAISIRFKLKMVVGGRYMIIFSTTRGTYDSGYQINLSASNELTITRAKGRSSSGTAGQDWLVKAPLSTGVFYDVCLIWDGTITGRVNLYLNDMVNPVDSVMPSSVTNFNHTYNVSFGRGWDSSSYYYANMEIDELEIYDRVISPIADKYLIIHNGQYKYNNGVSWLTTTASEANFIQYGMNNLSHITEAQWDLLQGEKSIAAWSDFEDKEYVSAILNTEEYSAYDLIGENPEVVFYTESTKDVVVSTETEPFDIYDELGEEVELLYYTDDTAITEADLILDANWSPVDELEGDFEVVTWTDEASTTAQRTLEMTAIPKPQFIRLVDIKNVTGFLDEVLVEDISISYRNEARYLLSDNNNRWYSFNLKTRVFEVVDASTDDLILKNGMKAEDIKKITQAEWRTWGKDKLSIGIFLKDNPRDTITSIVDKISYTDYLAKYTSVVQDASFYILNTTAKIDIELIGNMIQGTVSDDDLTRVQYRVFLNGNPHYPAGGGFTSLGASPQNIQLSFTSSEIKIDEVNTVRVEFQDFFGTTDSWTASFIGTYSGLMFKDVYGQYYSTEIGEVLQYLDFGTIIAGQTTIEHEVILKNQYGYDVNNLFIYANTSEFPNALECQFSQTLSPFVPNKELRYANTLANQEEMSFYIRLKSTLGATPDANGVFDIIVRADRVY